MEMNDDKNQDIMLDDLFLLAKTQDLQPSGALIARILQDAEAQQQVALAPVAKTGLLRALVRAIGGWPALAGLSTAMVAGIWIGVYPTTYFLDVLAQYSGDDSALYFVDYLPSNNFDLGEG